jgi:hypothetical protein
MTTQTIERTFPARIVKVDDEQRIAIGVVLEPRGPDDPDTQGDWHDAGDVEQAAYSFMKAAFAGEGWGDLLHDEVTKAGIPLESYIAPVDFALGTGERTQLVKAGSWVMAMHYPDADIWDGVKKGQLGAFSVAGFGKRISQEGT